jgi:hypothetical protein
MKGKINTGGQEDRRKTKKVDFLAHFEAQNWKVILQSPHLHGLGLIPPVSPYTMRVKCFGKSHESGSSLSSYLLRR